MQPAMQPGLTSLLWFAAILALIPLALWLLRRSPLVAGMGHKPGCPKAVAVLPLAAQHKLVTVEVGQGEDRLWLVLGVGPQGVRTLHTMVPQAESEQPPPPPAATFQQLLGRLKKGPHGTI